MKIKFIDMKNSLVEKVKALGIDAVCADYFLTALSIPQHVLMTASNPSFTFGGGIDFYFRQNFPLYCEAKQYRQGTMERIGNICFCITVDGNYQATKEQIQKALEFAIQNTHEGETLVISGIGTGIGFLSEDDFIRVLNEVIK